MPSRDRTPATAQLSPPRIQVLPVVDFTRGLNLRANPYQLATSESPDMNNVDVDPQGGITRRKAVYPIWEQEVVGTAPSVFPRVPSALMTYYPSDPTAQVQLVVQVGSIIGVRDIAATAGADFATKVVDTNTTNGRMRGTMSQGQTQANLYVQRSSDTTAFRWDGTNTTALTDSTDTDARTVNTYGQMPKAKLVTSHGDHTWVANQGTATTLSRVRFSHPGSAEDWHTNDFIDIAPGDGDEVTAIASFTDRLLVFKHKTMWGIFGTDFDNFNRVKLADVGAISQEAVAVAPHGVYFFAWPHGLLFYDGQSVMSVSDDVLRPLIEDGTILEQAAGSITVGWINRRVWVSVPTDVNAINSIRNDTVYVLDPSLKSGRGSVGAWVKYDLELGPFLTIQRPTKGSTTNFSNLAGGFGGGTTTATAEEPLYLAGSSTHGRVLRLETTTEDNDIIGVDGIRFHNRVSSYVSTPDAAALDIVGDLDLRVFVSQDALLTGVSSARVLAGKWGAAGQRSYVLYIVRTGGANFLAFDWSADGTAILQAVSTVALTGLEAAGRPIGLRATIDVNNGAAGRSVKFYTGVGFGTSNVAWTQLGATVTTAGVTSIFNSTAETTLGWTTTYVDVWAGVFHSFSVDNVFDTPSTGDVYVDFSAIRNPDVGTVADQITGTWTLNDVSMVGDLVSKNSRMIATSGVSYWSTPDAAAFSITGDIEISGKWALDDWTPASDMMLIGKWMGFGGVDQRSWALIARTDGTLRFEWSTNGTDQGNTATSSAHGIANGTAKYVKVTFDVNNGAAGKTANFYLSDDGETWTLLSTSTSGGTTSIFDGTGAITVGAQADNGSQRIMVGDFYSALVKNGIDGTTVASPSAVGLSYKTATGSPGTTHPDAQGNVWTTGASYRGLARQMDSYYRTAWLDAGDPAVIKRWKRPEITVAEGLTDPLTVDVHLDYEDDTSIKTLTIDTQSSDDTEVVRLPVLGRGRAIQLKFVGPDPTQPWSIFGIALKYIPRRLRG